MADEMKLSVDVSADLSKLDSSLMVAQQKVAAAGRSMQQSVTFAPGMLGAGSLPNQFGYSGNTVSFGGGLNAMSGNMMGNQIGYYGSPIGPTPANPNQHLTAQQITAMMGTRSMATGAGMGALRGAGITAGLGVAAALAVPSLFGRISGTAANYNRWGNEYNISQHFGADSPYRYQAAGEGEQALRNLPILGSVAAGYLDYTRENARNRGDLNGSVTPQGAADSASRIRATGLDLFMGFQGGGYQQQLRRIAIDRQFSQEELTSRAIQGGMNQKQFDIQTKQLDEMQGLAYTELKFGRSQSVADVQSFTSQNFMRAGGMGRMSNLMEINRSFREPIAKAKMQKDQQMASLLDRQRSSSVMAAMMGNIQSAQSVSPTLEAVGNVRVGSMSGQSAEFISFLKEIAHNTSQEPTPKVTRN